jgi:calcineurin-like phosphoesterase family protein
MDNKVFFIADLHFGHENMAKRRGFFDAEHMAEYIIAQWNSVVNKNDTVWVLGDITMEKKSGYEKLSRLKGHINVVLGNHDRRQDVPELLNYVNSVCGMVKFRNMILTHCPIHPSELYRFAVNIHGHVHEKSLRDKRYFNVSCEALDYKPIQYSEIKNASSMSYVSEFLNRIINS